MTCEDLRDSYELYTLGLVDDQEKREIEEHLGRNCAVCQKYLKDALGVNALLVRIFYRGPSEELLFNADRDICLIQDGRLREDEMRRLRINAGELTAKAHERGFDSLAEVESAMLYPNGTIYFHGRSHETEAARHAELLRRLDALSAEVAALRR